MKEILRATERAFNSIPERFRDYVTVKFATFFLEFGLGHAVKTPRNRFWGHQMLERWYRGEPTPLSLYASRLFDPSDFRISGSELLSNSPEIIVINQPNEGPLRGNWFKFVLNYAIAKARGREENFEAKWVQREMSEYPLLQNSLLGIQKRRLSQMIAKSCGTILVSSEESKKQNIRALMEMKRHLQSEGILVICPEGRDNRVLGRGRSEAGELLKLLAIKTKAPILPAAAFWTRDILNLRFGQTIDSTDLSSLTGQQMADLAMLEIAKLLPKEKRGVYRDSVKSTDRVVIRA